MVIRWDDVDQQDVLGLGVHARDFYLVAGEHPPGGSGCLGNLHGQRSLAGYGPRGHRVTAERLQHCAGYVVGAGTVSVEMNYYRKRLICPPPHMGPL